MDTSFDPGRRSSSQREKEQPGISKRARYAKCKGRDVWAKGMEQKTHPPHAWSMQTGKSEIGKPKAEREPAKASVKG
jgi:hypothetical protein